MAHRFSGEAMQRYVILLAILATGIAACGTAEGAKDGDMVAVHYVGTLDDGSEFDSSRNREPLEFEVGSDQVIAGFDAAVRGMSVGDTTTVRIPPEDAYGVVDSELVFNVPIEEAPEDVAIGDEVLIGGVTYGVVTAVGAAEVTIDTNHRFAGQALTFEIELVSIDQ
jgi:FKBP-type peptidyl-prolyl cis-trans isomerase 2